MVPQNPSYFIFTLFERDLSLEKIKDFVICGTLFTTTEEFCYSRYHESQRIKIILHDRKVRNYKHAVFIQKRNLDKPAIFAFVTALEKYLVELQKTNYSSHYRNYLFPKVANSVMKYTLKQMPSDFSNIIFKSVVIAFGMDSEKFSCHSLRKGGARHCLIYAVVK